MQANHQATAYIPWDNSTDWEEVAAKGVEWIEARCREEGVRSGLLITNDKTSAQVPSLQKFTRRHAHTTPKSRNDTRTPRNVPVLSYVPDIKGLETALSYSSRSSVCVVESSLFNLAGWAAAAGATNLATGEPTPPLDDDITAELDRLHFNGNNGWADQHGKQAARRTIEDLAGWSPPADPADTIAGWMLAKGASSDGAKRLHEMVRQSHPRR